VITETVSTVFIYLTHPIELFSRR